MQLLADGIQGNQEFSWAEGEHLSVQDSFSTLVPDGWSSWELLRSLSFCLSSWLPVTSLASLQHGSFSLKDSWLPLELVF